MIFILIFNKQISLYTLSIFLATSVFINFLYLTYKLPKIIFTFSDIYPYINNLLSYSKTTIGYYIYVCLTLFAINIDLIIISFFGSHYDLGIYSFAIKFISIPAFFLTTISHLYISKFSNLIHRGKLKSFLILYMQVSKKIFWYSIPLIFIFMLLAEQIVFMLNENYLESVSLIYIILVSQLLNLINGPNGLVLAFCGHIKTINIIYLISNFIFVLLIIYFYEKYNLIGIGYAYFINIFLWNLISSVMFKKFFHFWPFFFIKYDHKQ